MEDLCDTVLACLLSGSTNTTASPSRYITKPSGIPILSPVLFMYIGDLYIPPFLIRTFFHLLCFSNIAHDLSL